MLPAPVRALGGAGVASSRVTSAAPKVMPSAIAEMAPKRGRPDKAEREREKRRAMTDRILAFAETKPSKRDVREFFRSRIEELKDES